MTREEKRDRGKDPRRSDTIDEERGLNEGPTWENTAPTSDVKRWSREEEDEDVPPGDEEEFIEDDPMMSP
jgi:hypothetical protein